ncbi:hypothetical protein C1H46_027498 [Malus baccata]|uniref:Uncharacterized protein n=1 Tax=Malus baccata TaxID=106549 RepID=A0A540LKK9_MALBA|nr:hypothetical protein C1H46_027498 [Malus baccata]
MENDFSEMSGDYWPRDRCTYVNDSSAIACAMFAEEFPSPMPAECESNKRQNSPPLRCMMPSLNLNPISGGSCREQCKKEEEEREVERTRSMREIEKKYERKLERRREEREKYE